MPENAEPSLPPGIPPRILMLLTSHRLDCFRLTMDQLLATGELQKFDRVVLLLNGVVGKHQKAVDTLIAAHPEIPWDTISGPRGKGRFVANPQNECVRRYPNALYFKIDEDILVPAGWVDRMTAAWEAHRDDPKLSLLTPVVTNNATGFHFLLHAFPEIMAAYRDRFSEHPVTTEVTGPVWGQPLLAEWMIRNFLSLDDGNRRLAEKIEEGAVARFTPFAHRFSINNLVYDYRHWVELGGIPDDEEPAWTQWVGDHDRHVILVGDTLLHHYSFFVQQDWLDRTPLLEDLRAANAAASRMTPSALQRKLARTGRMLRQLPRVAKRRIGGK